MLCFALLVSLGFTLHLSQPCKELSHTADYLCMPVIMPETGSSRKYFAL